MPEINAYHFGVADDHTICTNSTDAISNKTMPEKHAHWIHDDQHEPNDYYGEWYCSHCGDYNDGTPDTCFLCGAIMDETEKEEER